MQYVFRWIQARARRPGGGTHVPRALPAAAGSSIRHALPEKFDKDNKKPFRSRQSPSDDRRARHGTLNGFGPPPCGAGHQAAL
ncbi:hypothetical protein [Cupriavidus nantongensis]|uniref:hypothetical protein n=1 Tax=Cupriavidus nantongensis TaxID=1796606 RepID=UPI00358E4859